MEPARRGLQRLDPPPFSTLVVRGAADLPRQAGGRATVLNMALSA